MNISPALTTVISFEKKLLGDYLVWLEESNFELTYPDYLQHRIVGSLKIMRSLMNYAPPGGMEDWEYPMVFAGIEDLMKKGWFPHEIVQKLRWLEHVNPETEEDVALRNMRVMDERVAHRLATTK